MSSLAVRRAGRRMPAHGLRLPAGTRRGSRRQPLRHPFDAVRERASSFKEAMFREAAALGASSIRVDVSVAIVRRAMSATGDRSTSTSRSPAATGCRSSACCSTRHGGWLPLRCRPSSTSARCPTPGVCRPHPARSPRARAASSTTGRSATSRTASWAYLGEPRRLRARVRGRGRRDPCRQPARAGPARRRDDAAQPRLAARRVRCRRRRR